MKWGAGKGEPGWLPFSSRDAQYCPSEDRAGFATAGCATFAAEMEGRNGAGWGNISDAAPRLGLAGTPTARIILYIRAGRDVIRVTLQSLPNRHAFPAIALAESRPAAPSELRARKQEKEQRRVRRSTPALL